jgi:hypothetical protein
MTASTNSLSLPIRLPHPARADLLFAFGVLVFYVLATAMAASLASPGPDSMMLVAQRAWTGHLDAPGLKGVVDTVTLDGRYYFALGPMQLLPYLPFAGVAQLQGSCQFVVCLLFGIPAAWLSLPLARRFGATGTDAFWIAGFTAFGSLLSYVSVLGDVYYLAQAESFLALSLFLLEWTGRRRPVVLGALLAVSFLARPTTLIAAVPFGLVLLWQHRSELQAAARSALAFGLPIAGAIAVYFWFNWVRFGSPLETGYAISYLSHQDLIDRRAMGLFSIRHIPENLRLALLALPGVVGKLPYFVPNREGMSMLLVSPALLTALWAGFRAQAAKLLWIAAAMVALPVFLYYGGGFQQYGFRYSLDFTPFLVALMAMGSRRWIGWPERLLVFASMVFVSWGLLWGIGWHAA